MPDAHENRYQDLTEAPIHWSVKFGENVKVGHYVTIDEGSQIGNNVIIGHGVKIRSDVTIGNDCMIGHNTVFESDANVGNNVTIHCQCHITKYAVIKDYCFLGPKTMCINTYHISHGRDFDAKLTGPVFGWGSRVGSGAIIMPGVKLGRECEIGAGAVVTKDTKEFTTYAGIPAKETRKVPLSERLRWP
jgi:UDP-2-acetamido-3-amino-2,3-dideoxy-glucuronate N-acetyltransferase